MGVQWGEIGASRAYAGSLRGCLLLGCVTNKDVEQENEMPGAVYVLRLISMYRIIGQIAKSMGSVGFAKSGFGIR